MRRAMFAGAAAAFLLPAVAGVAAPQDSPAQVGLEERVSVQLVQVGFLATDRKGRPIHDLSPEDIDVLEGGKRQPIAFLEPYYTSMKKDAAGARPASPVSVLDAGAPPRITSPGRWVVLVLDASTSSTRTRIRSLEAMREFVDGSLGGDDRAALAFFDGKLDVVQTFTRDRDVLRRATDHLMGRLDHASEDRAEAVETLLEQMEGCRGQGPLQPSCAQRVGASYEDARVREAKDFLYALRTLTLSVAPIPDLKAVVVFSDGFARNPFSDAFDAARAVLGFPIAQQISATLSDRVDAEFDGLAAEAAMARVCFFTIYPGGAAGQSSVSAARGGMPSELRNPENIDVYRRSAANYGHGLAELARRTGGHFSQGNDPSAQLRNAWEMSSGLYTVGYYLADAPPSGRRLDVRIRARRKGVVIESRREVPAPSGSFRLRGSLTAQADACGEEGRRYASVRLSLDPAVLTFEPAGKDSNAGVSVYLSLVDPVTQAALFEDYRFLKITRSADRNDAAADVPPQLELTLRVPCRALSVKAVAVDTATGGRASFSTDLGG